MELSSEKGNVNDNDNGNDNVNDIVNDNGSENDSDNNKENDKCKSKCYKYKTDKGYLCNEIAKGYFQKKKWCRIDNQDVINNSLSLEKPNKDMYGYWDYISEDSKNEICYANDSHSSISYKPCTFQDKRSFLYYLFSLLMLSLKIAGGAFIGIEAVGSSHLMQTINLTKMSNKAFLQYMLGKFNKLLNENFIKNNILEPNEVNNIIGELRQKINNIDNEDTLAAGGLLKDIFSQSVDLMKANAGTFEGYSTSVMQFLIDKVPTQYMLDALRGANFVLQDGGAIYRYTRDFMLGYGRFSSHAKNETAAIQYGNTDLFADAYLHLLSGTFHYADTGEVVSWFQLEGAPMPPGLTTVEVFKKMISGRNVRDFKYYIDHFVDSTYYFAYMTRVKMVGGEAINLALGKSAHTDKNPIYIYFILKLTLL